MWKYVRVIWEGDDNKPSIRRVTSLAFTFLIFYLVVGDRVTTEVAFKTVVSLLLAILLLLAVVTADNLIKLVKGTKGKDESN